MTIKKVKEDTKKKKNIYFHITFIPSSRTGNSKLWWKEQWFPMGSEKRIDRKRIRRNFLTDQNVL